LAGVGNQGVGDVLPVLVFGDVENLIDVPPQAVGDD
jgi:hypothetical protein